MSVWFVIAVALFSFTADRAVRMLLALYALQFGAQPVTVGLVAATLAAFPMFVAVPAGQIADRFGARWPVSAGAALCCCGLLLPFLLPGLPALFAAAALHGVGFAMANVALQNLVGVLSNKSNRTQNFGNFSLMVSTASFIGPLAVGFSIDHDGAVHTCLYVALFAITPALLLALWGRGMPAGKREAAAGGSVRDALKDPAVLRVLAFAAMVMAAVDLFHFFMPVYGHSIGLSASAIGMVLAAFSTAAFVVRIFLTRLLNRFSAEDALAGAFCLGGLCFLLVPLLQGPAALALIAFVYGLSMGCGQPIITTLMFSRSAAGRSGEALGLRLTVNYLSRMVGPVVFGSIASLAGVGSVFWVGGLLLGGGGLLGRRHRKGE